MFIPQGLKSGLLKGRVKECVYQIAARPTEGSKLSLGAIVVRFSFG